MQSRTKSGAILVLAVGLTGFIGGGKAEAKARTVDFNSDGNADLVVGISSEPNDTDINVGAVEVIYGMDNKGLHVNHSQFWTTQLVFGEPGVENDFFGFAVATGDFNHDGYTDLAMSAPGREGLFKEDIGAVYVMYGSYAGLTPLHSQKFSRETPGVDGGAGRGDFFGFAMIAGDFNGDGRDDLAISARNVDIGHPRHPELHILYGSANGLTASHDQRFQQVDLDPTTATDDLNFGTVMAVGDFNRDGKDDLALGSPNRVDGVAVGAVYVMYGTSNGLKTNNVQLIEQGVDGVDGVPEANDGFGATLAAGDFNGDGRDDLAITVPNDGDAGIVQVLYGRSGGLRSNDQQTWSQDTPGIRDASEPGEAFGFAMAVGDFNKDGKDDLAISTPNETVNGALGAGVVNVIYGSSHGLDDNGDQLWSQDSNKIKGSPGFMDFFGIAMTAGDYDNDGRDDLAIGASGDQLFGAVAVIYGKNSNGLNYAKNQLWNGNNLNQFLVEFGSAMK
ncbi:MAG TPA: hypothetical protein VG711_11565 [Phycisphaerales bacterium]|nr:hypothetical protein [Phycisphaerales bacterium]